jgi:hypothetical protein
MSERTLVVEDGTDPTQVGRRTRSPLAILVLGFVLGLGFGSLVGPRSGVDPAAEPQTLPTTPEETPDAQAPSGLADLVPGWHDSLVAIADSDTGVLRMSMAGLGEPQRAQWPEVSPPARRWRRNDRPDSAVH